MLHRQKRRHWIVTAMMVLLILVGGFVAYYLITGIEGEKDTQPLRMQYMLSQPLESEEEGIQHIEPSGEIESPQVSEQSKVQVGDTVFFGTYEQDNDVTNGNEAIQWRVLDVQGNKALIISQYGLDAQPYHKTNDGVTWETSFLRDWLNSEFLYTAFTDGEEKNIITEMVSADANSYYGTDPGNATQDKVFLLSEAEIQKYLTSDKERFCKPTDYAIARGAWKSDDVSFSEYYGHCWWWMHRKVFRHRLSLTFIWLLKTIWK